MSVGEIDGVEESSGLRTTSAAIRTTPCRMYNLTLIAGTAASSITLYDNASAASGTVLAKVSEATAGASRHQHYGKPVAASNGIYAALTGANAAYIVYSVK